MRTVRISKSVKVITRISFCVLALLVGVIGMSAFAKMKKAPAEVKYK